MHALLDLSIETASSDGDRTRDAMTKAGQAGQHLLVRLGAAAPSPDLVGALITVLDRDPFFGIVHPRFARDGGPSVLPLAPEGGPQPLSPPASEPIGELPRAALSALPLLYILPEYLSPCFIIRWELLANVPPQSAEGSAFDILIAYQRRVMRLGFRSIVANTVVMSLPAAEAWPPAATSFDEATGGDITRRDELQREQRIGALYHRPRRLLIDARNLQPTTNGTTKTILGLADALHAAASPWATVLWTSEASAEAHAIAARYPRWTVVSGAVAGSFAVAFRPSQPWMASELLHLHRAALVNISLMLDTIAWDVGYVAPPGLDATWRFAARYSDGIVFISEFSRQRFLQRFPMHPHVRTAVCHLSLNPSEYVDPIAAGTRPVTPYWLIVGNAYDHKNVTPTLELLADRFPAMAVAVLGSQTNEGGTAELLSGQMSEREVQTQYAGAEVVIFPSFYEGFGLPVVNALAYGRTVVARESQLLREIAARYRGPGRLVAFSTTDELADRLAKLRAGEDVPEIALSASGDDVFGWQEAARTIEALMTALVEPGAARRERARHEAVMAFVAD